VGRRPNLKLLYMTASDVPSEQADGTVLRKPLSPEHLVFEAGMALANASGSAAFNNEAVPVTSPRPATASRSSCRRHCDRQARRPGLPRHRGSHCA
jgi:hypothetical protein